FGGPGGNITIVADNFLASPDSSITASSALSTPGTVDIQARIVDLSGSLAPLPDNVLQATALSQQSCAARFGGGKVSSLVLAGRDALPLEPGGFMPSPLLVAGDQRSEVPSTALRTGSDQSAVGGQSSVVGTQWSEFVHEQANTLASAKSLLSMNWP